MTSIEDWVEGSPYSVALGVRLDTLTDGEARLGLPYQEANSNPGDALHGGCAASLGLIGGQAVARRALGDGFATFHTAATHVSYLAAAIGEDVVATSSLLRRGKEMCFVETLIETTDGKPISHVTALVRGRTAGAEAALAPAAGDDGAADPGEMGPFVGMMSFTSARGLDVEHMVDGRSRITMPALEANADGAGGQHEGAVLALVDTTGAMAAWAETGPGRYKASTASLQARVVAPPPPEGLVGFGRVIERDGDLFWADVEVADAAGAGGSVWCRGTVVYRIVT